MAKFRKKPVVIEAVQLTFALCVGNTQLPDWANGKVSAATHERLQIDGEVAFIKNTRNAELPAFVRIATLEGVMLGQQGDWLIKGVQNEVYACKPDIFAATYEPVTE